MNRISIIAAFLFFAATSLAAQSLNSTNGGFPTKTKIDGKKFRVAYYEHEIDKTMEEVWAEVAGNYVNVGQVSATITEAHCESGDLTEGLGAKRFCALDFKGKTIEIKEEIIDLKETSNRKEFTYFVYDSKGFPAKVYNTWVVRKGENGKTYLGTAFIMRGNMPMMTGLMMKQLLKAGGVTNGVLSYKHFLETGEGNVPGEQLASLYPKQL